MSERWKYQLKIGLPWTIFMCVFMFVFQVTDKTFLEHVQSVAFYVQLTGFFIVGVFVVGYSGWTSKMDREKNKKNGE